MAGMKLLVTNSLGKERGFAGRGAASARRDRLRKKAVLALLAKGPGLKPLYSIGFIQGAEAPCSLRKAKTGVFPQVVETNARAGWR